MCKTGLTIHTLESHTEKVRAVAFSPDGNTLVTGAGDNKIIFWNPNTGLQKKFPMRMQFNNRHKQHSNEITGLSFSPRWKNIGNFK